MTALGGGLCKMFDNQRCGDYDRRDSHRYSDDLCDYRLGYGVGFGNGVGCGWNNMLGFGWNNGYGNGWNNKSNCDNATSMTSEDLYIERKQAQNFIDTTKEYYEGKLQGQRDLTNAFFDAYKRDVDNSFSLYKGYRDADDQTNSRLTKVAFDLYKNQRDEDDKTNHRLTDVAFNLYKNQRDEKDILNEKINQLQCKVNVMEAVRPYQDALINAKIDKNAMIADFNLSKRTCKMIEGQLILPNDPTVTGLPSMKYCNC